jgi:membrane protein implicated in regulation of membrane protease activity
MGLSTGGVILTRRLLPKRKVSAIEDSKEAETLTEILPGEAGRVLYEGNSWRARCEDDKLAIPPKQKVYVVRREGTTLIVVPEHLLHS